MWLPMTRQQWEKEKRLYRLMDQDLLDRHWPYLKAPELAVQNNANWLLARLYEPNAEIGAIASKRAFRKANAPPGIADEPINWGDLHAMVENEQGVFVVTLEEASPDQCPCLCEYVRNWLERWGWTPVRVETEW